MQIFNRSKKFLYIILAAIMCACALTACTYSQYESFEEGNINGGYNKHDAFVGMCFWDGGDKVIELPDEYNGLPVTTLGGYIGIGSPDPFAIVLRDENYRMYRDSFINAIELPDDEYETITFTVKIGKNLRGIEDALGKLFFGIETIDENGNEIIDIVYKVAYYFEVDSNNKTFYSKDGKLYNKSDDTIVDTFFYE